MTLLSGMTDALQLPSQYLLGWGRKADHAYATYQIPKKRGGFRTIHHPARELKALQRWLLQNVICLWRVHPCATAYREGRSIQDNARVHKDSRFLLKMDFAEFFPSITADDVRRYLSSNPTGTTSWTGIDRELFVDLVTKEGRLTIGAPSSPALSNALCFELDIEVSGMADRHGLNYTRYADDMFFSSQEPDVLREAEQHVYDIVADLELPAGLSINRGKTRHLSKRVRRQVTGLILGSAGELSVGRYRKRYVRRQLHQFEGLNATDRSELRGLLAFVRGVEPDFVNAMILKYGAKRVADAERGDQAS